jgi:heptosyltransferase-1
MYWRLWIPLLMRNLIIKTSSLGDIIHTLPAITDAVQAYPDIRFDWVVEENFAEIPAWHPAVEKIIPIAWRRWRKNLLKLKTYRELKIFNDQLKSTPYSRVIDLQGLVKSALVTRCASLDSSGLRCGLNRQSARESLASLFYQRTYAVNPQQHAVTRMRQLLAAALDYPVPDTAPNYGIDITRFPSVPSVDQNKPNIIFLHGTTWETKLWPESYWIALAQQATKAGYTVLLPWSNDSERKRAERIAQISPLVSILPRLNLSEMASVLTRAQGIVAVDTGLGHLAAALGIPTISLYGPTNPNLTGTVGDNQHHFAAQFPCAPCLQSKCTYTQLTDVFPACFGTISSNKVWIELNSLLP